MNALVYHGPWNLSLEELPRPRCRATEVLLRMKAVGICGSDVHGYTGESGRRAPGMVMGHEAVGVVEEIGDQVTQSRIGDLVAVYNILAETAPTPEEGDPSFLDKQVIGVNLAQRGAMADYLALPAGNALALPPGTDPAVGVLAEPIAVVTHGFDRLAERNLGGARTAIVGAGTIGLSAALVARDTGGERLAVLDTIPEKLDRAKAFGAAPVWVESVEDAAGTARRVEAALGGRPELVVDAMGSRSSFRQSLEMIQAGGTLLLIGNLAKEVGLLLQDIVSREVTLVGTYGFDRAAFEAALQRLPQWQEELTSFIEGRCTLAETPDVMNRLAKGELNALKVVIDF